MTIPEQASAMVKQQKQAGKRTAILVLGMDRSGTSLTTHVLHTLGAFVPHDRIGPSVGNPLGHWEPRSLVSLNDEILGQLGLRWDDPRPLPDGWFCSRQAHNAVRRITAEIHVSYGEAPLLVIKDPRLCRLLPLYSEALKALDIKLAVVLQVRRTAEVMQSLFERDELPQGLSGLLWLRAVTDAEWFSRECSRVWVSFRQMTTDWRATVDRIGQRLEVEWPIHPDDAAAQIVRLLRPRRRHDTFNVQSKTLAEAWDAIQAGLANDEVTARTGFDRARTSLREADLLYVSAMTHRVGQLDAELQAIRFSTCWRLTGPLRGLKRLISSTPVTAAFSRLLSILASTRPSRKTHLYTGFEERISADEMVIFTKPSAAVE